MRKSLLKIGMMLLTYCLWGSCSENEVVESYEEIQDSKPVPISFEPYYISATEEEASTRAYLSYLTYYANTSSDPWGVGYFKYIPYYGYKGGDSSSWGTGFNRFGSAAYNSYIVGLFAYSHSNLWNNDRSSATANIMTNQPLFCFAKPGKKPVWNTSTYTSDTYWKYGPKKYWPNGQKVTFIAYYPFQDYAKLADGVTEGPYYLDGERSRKNDDITIDGVTYEDPYKDTTERRETDLRNIQVPALDAAQGAPSYTFTFTQKEDVRQHVDFLMGITSNQTKSNVDGNGNITLNMRHTLCAVRFNFIAGSIQQRTPDDQTLPTSMEAIINKVGLEGLFTEGDVYPEGDHDSASIVWTNQRKPNSDPQYSSASTADAQKGYYSTYMVDFDIDAVGDGEYYPYDAFKNHYDERPVFTLSGSTISGVHHTAANIYHNQDNNFTNNKSTGRGFRYLLLVIPQTAEAMVDDVEKDAYLVVDYDMTCTYSDGQKVVYNGTQQKIKLKDPVNNNGVKTGNLFKAGKMLTFNVTMNLNGIGMDVQETDWDDALDRQLPVDEKETESGS